MVPSASRETFTPAFPRRTYCIDVPPKSLHGAGNDANSALSVRSDMRSHPGRASVNIGKRSPKIIKSAAGAFREDDIAAAVTRPGLGAGLPEQDVAADIQHQDREQQACGRGGGFSH